jgi:hypothetical protein
MTEAEQRRADLLKALRGACNAFDNHPPQDTNGRQDILHRVKHIEGELAALGGYSDSEFVEYCKAADIAEAEAKRVAAERSHDRREAKF